MSKYLILMGFGFIFCVEAKVGDNLKEWKNEVKERHESLDAWKLPDENLRFDQVSYLGAHNAHVNLQEGFAYNQQRWSVDNQLKNGVRHFLIDVWDSKDGTALLCHGKCETVSMAQRAGVGKHRTFKSYLETFKRFLDAHPKEILSLELERGDIFNARILKEIESVPGLSKYVLTKKEYDPKDHDGKWPTLKWMIDNGKRLVIFDTLMADKYGYNTDQYLTRNMYGTLDIDKACQIRNKAKGSRLFQMNYFATVTNKLPRFNTATRLNEVLSQCKKNGVVSSDQIPNFVALDMVNIGNPMKFVNQLNDAAKAKLSGAEPNKMVSVVSDVMSKVSKK